MQIRDVKLSRAELDDIYKDFESIDRRLGIPAENSVRFELGAFEGGNIVGYVSGISEHELFYLSDLWVSERYRGKGLGNELLRLIEQKASGVCRHIYTWTAGERNLRFYKKNGYEVFVVFEDFTGVKGHDKAGLRKELTGNR